MKWSYLLLGIPSWSRIKPLLVFSHNDIPLTKIIHVNLKTVRISASGVDNYVCSLTNQKEVWDLECSYASTPAAVNVKRRRRAAIHEHLFQLLQL